MKGRYNEEGRDGLVMAFVLLCGGNPGATGSGVPVTTPRKFSSCRDFRRPLPLPTPTAACRLLSLFESPCSAT